MPEINNPNLLMLEMAAEKLGSLVNAVVFLGGWRRSVWQNTGLTNLLNTDSKPSSEAVHV